eukprot:TRINITY_DN22392_c0_g1_i1.p1 TRINITY_DN22392_c0_g1~~TRINITY_DN22392_c0_g1_i1.p1  ORF type:complete len:148 (-),score=51.80 TRINITY_DN22392_c0_g1_i1:799-1242(-)
MGVVFLDGSTVRKFVEHEEAFNKSIDEKFKELDTNGDGVLQVKELRTILESLNLIEMHFGVPVSKSCKELNELYDNIFNGFDYNHDGVVSLVEFRSEMKKVLLAIADGLGEVPLQVVVEDDSLLKAAADDELQSSKKAVHSAAHSGA